MRELSSRKVKCLKIGFVAVPKYSAGAPKIFIKSEMHLGRLVFRHGSPCDNLSLRLHEPLLGYSRPILNLESRNSKLRWNSHIDTVRSLKKFPKYSWVINLAGWNHNLD